MNIKQTAILTLAMLCCFSQVGALAANKKLNEADAHNKKGIELDGQKQFDAAIAEFNLAIQAAPEIASLYRNRGTVYRQTEKYPEAMADFSKMIELDPTNPQGYFERGQTEVLMPHKPGVTEQFDAALTDLNKAIELKPDDIDAYRFRGFANIGKSDWNAAIADFDKVIASTPQDARAYERRAFAKRSLHKFDDALADYSKAIEINPNDFESFDKRGYTYSLMKQWAKAVPDFKAALTIKPNEPDTLSRLRYAEQQLAPPPAPAPPPPPPPAPLISRTGWIIIGAVAIVLLLVIIAFVVRGRSQSE